MVTYPRSGQHYLVDLIKQQLGFDIEFEHDCVISGYDLYISIARNPFDSIASWVTMEIECGPIENSKEYPMNVYIDKAIQQYILFYTYANKRVNLFIDYEDLINYPEKIIDLIAKKMEIEKITNEYISTISDHRPGRFLKTSTTTDTYSQVIKELKNINLNICNRLYDQAKTSCAILNI